MAEVDLEDEQRKRATGQQPPPVPPGATPPAQSAPANQPPVPGGAGKSIWDALKWLKQNKPALPGDVPDQRFQANKTAQQLADERAAFGGNAAPTLDRRAMDTIARRERDIRNLQTQNLGALMAAAEGKTPSVAEIQGRMQADRNAAQQFGMAAALSGASPGAGLRQASLGAAQVQGEAGANAALLRAQETAAARNALTGALTGVRGQDQSQRGQEIDMSGIDLRAALEQRGMDQDWRKALLAGQLTSQGQAGGIYGDELQADVMRERMAQEQGRYEDQFDWKKQLKSPSFWLGALQGGAQAYTAYQTGKKSP